jgi:hypothetical protein
LLTREKVWGILANIRDTYNPKDDKYGALARFEEIDQALAHKVIDERKALEEKLDLIEGIENGSLRLRLDFTDAKDLAKKGLLTAEKFDDMVWKKVAEAEEEAHKLKAEEVERRWKESERKRLSVEPQLMSNVERDEMLAAIEKKLKSGELSQKKAAEMSKEMEIYFNVIDIREVPHLVRAGELSSERARDMLGSAQERFRNEQIEIEKAIEFRELKEEDETVARGYSLVDQLKEAGKLEFGSAELMKLKDEIIKMGSKLYKTRKAKEGLGTFGRVAEFFRSKFTGKGKELAADSEKFRELLEKRRQMESEFWKSVPVGVLSARDIETLMKYNVFERWPTLEERKSAEEQVFPVRAERVMRRVMQGELDPDRGINTVKRMSEVHKRNRDLIIKREFEVGEVSRSCKLVDTLHKRGEISFSRDNFLEILARTRAPHLTPKDKVEARRKLLEMEGEIRKAMEKSSDEKMREAIGIFEARERELEERLRVAA